MRWNAGRVVGAVLAVLVVAVAAVVAVDRWRASGVRPPDCSSVILEQARGPQRADSGLQTDAWTVLAGRDRRAVGDLDGLPFELDRSCLLYAGPTATGADDPSVVDVESTVSGDTVLLRIAEVRPRSGMLAGVGYPVRIGSEAQAGLVLPLSGAYLAPPDVTGVRLLAGKVPVAAPETADGVFDLGVVPDRSRVPTAQGPEHPAAMLLDRTDASAPVMVVVPVLPRDDGPPLRIPMTVRIDDRATADAATLAAVTAVMPLFLADRRLPVLLDRAPGSPTLAVRTAAVAGGRGVVVEAGDAQANPGLPVFRFFVPAAGRAVAVT